MRLIGFFIRIRTTIQLVLSLMREPRIHWAIKLIPVAAVAYVLSPVDLIS